MPLTQHNSKHLFQFIIMCTYIVHHPICKIFHIGLFLALSKFLSSLCICNARMIKKTIQFSKEHLWKHFDFEQNALHCFSPPSAVVRTIKRSEKENYHVYFKNPFKWLTVTFIFGTLSIWFFVSPSMCLILKSVLLMFFFASIKFDSICAK